MTLDLESDRPAFRISRDPLGNLRERIRVFIGRFVHLTGKMLDDVGMHVKVAVEPFLRRTWSDVLCFRLRGSMWTKSKQMKEFMAIFIVSVMFRMQALKYRSVTDIVCRVDSLRFTKLRCFLSLVLSFYSKYNFLTASN